MYPVFENLRDERGWPIRESKLKDILGVPRKMPPSYTLQLTRVVNTLVYVKARTKTGSREHRVIAICADCGKHVPAGRLWQHRKIHGEGARASVAATSTPLYNRWTGEIIRS